MTYSLDNEIEAETSGTSGGSFGVCNCPSCVAFKSTIGISGGTVSEEVKNDLLTN